MGLVALVSAVAAVAIGPLGGLGSGAGQPGPDVDVQRCQNAASHIPEFGGAYLAERGQDGAMVLHVWMTEADAAATDAAVAALGDRCPDYGDVVIRNASYSYSQLSDWQRVAWTVPGVTLTGIDARTNRLTVGVAPGSDRSKVTQALSQRGVPGDAIALMEISEARAAPIVDHSRVVALAAGLGLTVVVAAVGVVWLRRRRTASRT